VCGAIRAPRHPSATCKRSFLWDGSHVPIPIVSARNLETVQAVGLTPVLDDVRRAITFRMLNERAWALRDRQAPVIYATDTPTHGIGTQLTRLVCNLEMYDGGRRHGGATYIVMVRRSDIPSPLIVTQGSVVAGVDVSPDTVVRHRRDFGHLPCSLSVGAYLRWTGDHRTRKLVTTDGNSTTKGGVS
jgi:hypothetical protein